VVDAVTGAAIPRARVMLQGPAASAPVTTDADGGFTFSGLPAGPVILMVQKATYMPTRYPIAGRTMRAQTRPLILRDAQVVDDIVVPIFHGGSISGRVFDASGDPVESATVSLMRLPRSGGTGNPTQRGGMSTNDLGEYRFGRLEPGTYVVFAAARSGEMMGPSQAAQASTPPEAQPVPTFYPNAVSIDQAQPIVVEKGQSVAGLDIILGEGLPGVVTGTVLTSDGQPLPPNTYPMVMIRRVLSGMWGGFDFSASGASTRPDGTFRAVLAPGDYMIEARIMTRTGPGFVRSDDEQLAMARVSVVSGGEESLTMMVGPGATATGRVIFETGTPPIAPSGRVHVPMMSEGAMCRSGEAEVAADWSFKMTGLSGTCSAQPTMLFGRWTLKSVIVNGRNLPDGPVTFQPGQQFRDVQIVVTDRQSSLVFQVSDENGQDTRDYVILAFPVEKSRWANGARTFMTPIMSNPDAMRTTSMVPGAAPVVPIRPPTMSGLRSGDYYVVAVDDLEFDDTRDPAVLERLRSSATRVSVAEGGTTPVSLRRVNFAQAMQQK
jgi:hypothetical protein